MCKQYEWVPSNIEANKLNTLFYLNCVVLCKKRLIRFTTEWNGRQIKSAGANLHKARTRTGAGSEISTFPGRNKCNFQFSFSYSSRFCISKQRQLDNPPFVPFIWSEIVFSAFLYKDNLINFIIVNISHFLFIVGYAGIFFTFGKLILMEEVRDYIMNNLVNLILAYYYKVRKNTSRTVKQKINKK